MPILYAPVRPGTGPGWVSRGSGPSTGQRGGGGGAGGAGDQGSPVQRDLPRARGGGAGHAGHPGASHQVQGAPLARPPHLHARIPRSNVNYGSALPRLEFSKRQRACCFVVPCEHCYATSEPVSCSPLRSNRKICNHDLSSKGRRLLHCSRIPLQNLVCNELTASVCCACAESCGGMQGRVYTLQDVWVRPVLGGKGRRVTGQLEAHANGFHYQSPKGEILDIMYRCGRGGCPQSAV